MIDLLSTCQMLLKDANFNVRLSNVGGASVVCFEDGALIGFCCQFENPEILLDKWKSTEQEILVRFAPNFRSAGDKAWNVYCVFLSPAIASDAQKREVSWIEEDLDRTRKIAACGVSSREQVIRALLPILPIQHQATLLDAEVTERLKRRISDISPNAVHVALEPSVAPAEVVRRLGERP